MHGPSLIGMLQSSRGAQQKQQQQHYLNLILILPGVTVVLSLLPTVPCVRLSGTVYLSKALPTVRSSASVSSSCPASPPPSRASPRNCRRRSPIISSIHKWPIDVNCSDYTKIGLNLPGCQRLRKFPTMIRARPTKQPPLPLMMTPHLCPVPLHGVTPIHYQGLCCCVLVPFQGGTIFLISQLAISEEWRVFAKMPLPTIIILTIA